MASSRVCKYFLMGTCKFGDNCRFEHTTPADANVNDQGGSGSDPFATNQTTTFNNASTQNEKDAPPTWPLTAIALQDTSSGNLIGDEYSPDEMRVQAYRAAPRGNAPEVARREGELLRVHQEKEAAARARDKPQPIAARDPFAGAQENGTSTFGSSNHNSNNDNSMSTGSPFGTNNSNPFGAPTNVTAASSFGNFNPTPFSSSTPALMQGPFSTPSQQQPATNMVKQESTPSLSTRDLAQYNAPSFGFDPVPETAPPPRFC